MDVPITRLEDVTAENASSKGALAFVLAQPGAREAFVRYCVSQHSEEGILCWKAIQDLKAVPSEDARAVESAVNSIIDQFIKPGCAHEISLPAGMTRSLLRAHEERTLHAGSFDACVAVLEKEMAGDIMPRFIKSQQWKECLSAGPAPSSGPGAGGNKATSSRPGSQASTSPANGEKAQKPASVWRLLLCPIHRKNNKPPSSSSSTSTPGSSTPPSSRRSLHAKPNPAQLPLQRSNSARNTAMTANTTTTPAAAAVDKAQQDMMILNPLAAAREPTPSTSSSVTKVTVESMTSSPAQPQQQARRPYTPMSQRHMSTPVSRIAGVVPFTLPRELSVGHSSNNIYKSRHASLSGAASRLRHSLGDMVRRRSVVSLSTTGAGTSAQSAGAADARPHIMAGQLSPDNSSSAAATSSGKQKYPHTAPPSAAMVAARAINSSAPRFANNTTPGAHDSEPAVHDNPLYRAKRTTSAATPCHTTHNRTPPPPPPNNYNAQVSLSTSATAASKAVLERSKSASGASLQGNAAMLQGKIAPRPQSRARLPALPGR